jgi:hypothetical protein
MTMLYAVISRVTNRPLMSGLLLYFWSDLAVEAIKASFTDRKLFEFFSC